jgi:hypothetical protein
VGAGARCELAGSRCTGQVAADIDRARHAEVAGELERTQAVRASLVGWWPTQAVPRRVQLISRQAVPEELHAALVARPAE